MPDNEIENKIEQIVVAEEAGAFPIETSGETVSGERLIADGGDGQEKEYVVLDPIAGASSSAPASSGIPSAVRQQSIHTGVNAPDAQAETGETAMPNRTVPMREDLKP